MTDHCSVSNSMNGGTGKRKRDENSNYTVLDLDYKVFNDPIHGHIEIHPLCMKIIDTPEFQRLRYLKQLGPCYYVFPGASHNRFEHSIGVCHLAGEMVCRLQKQQPELGITDVDVLCVKIGGLCHDLGHGPFSHLYDTRFIQSVNPGSKWTHEKASIQMFEHLIEENNLEKDFEEYNLTRQDRDFIKEQFNGPLNEDKIYKGRPDKKYLYEIVANKRNSVDVDKWDYFARDCYMLGIKNNFDHNRFMRFFRVIEDKNGDQQICLRDKEVENLYDMFHTRKTLHSRAYQHAVTQAVGCMIVDALIIADKCEKFRILGTDNTPRRLSECIEDMEAYKKLDDTIFQRIMRSRKPGLQGARDLIDRIQKRQLYRCVGSTHRPEGLDKKEDKKLLEEIAELDGELKPEFLTLACVHYDYGMKNKNPVDNTRFYTKSKPNECKRLRKHQVSQLLPEHFQEDMIRIFCKEHNPQIIQAAKSAFEKWCFENELVAKTDRWVLTPAKSHDMMSSSPADSATTTSPHIGDKDRIKKNIFAINSNKKRRRQ
ncbi:deoxynucleoside triphosphate triphosphohydrolase SAMHD1 isoform X2 [Patella vulgata]|uniref:deoxynucleoside triphosphate triphosphohydrolase SAMHD1 isoform X2 n=1 Tax=Patella vulgata TaxID=6465 RepID=UPI00217FFC83|nr:deoxynucleoside triphosphate triphosphohydrolase SAMHD1 isoform X2 [Patella vulgata]